MSARIFFSWQSDTPNRENRSLIHDCLTTAIRRLAEDFELEEAVRNDLSLDADTRGVPGTPPIVETIFKKIDSAAVFVADMTFVGKRIDDRPTPNPNVLIEYGWALKSLSHSRVLAVANTAMGMLTPDTVPFDIAHTRFPIAYHLPHDSTADDKRAVIDELTKKLEGALKAILGSQEFKNHLPQSNTPPLFEPAKTFARASQFRPVGKPFGKNFDVSFFGGAEKVVPYPGRPMIWLRVMPHFDTGRKWLVTDLKKLIAQPTFSLLPISGPRYGGLSYVREVDGCGLYSVASKDDIEPPAFVYVFANGEIWSADARVIDDARGPPASIPLERKWYVVTLKAYFNFLRDKLQIAPPYRWIAGIEGIRDRGLFTSSGTYRPKGASVEDEISVDGTIGTEEAAEKEIASFFRRVYDSCGVEPEEWMHAAAGGMDVG